MPNLTEFLTARLDEDEAIAREALHPFEWYGDTGAPGYFLGRDDHEEEAFFVYPSRVLVEVEAKRRIVALFTEAGEASKRSGMYESADDYMESTLVFLAAVYADHPDYDEAWRP